VLTLACCAAAAACSGGNDPAGRREARSALGAAGGGPATLVQDLRTGGLPYGSTPHGFVVTSPTRAFFVADDGQSGNELWVTDLGAGAASGTSLVADLRPGSASALPPPGTRFEAVPFGAGILFAADDGARGSELWFSDGTAGGTRLVRDVSPGTDPSSPRAFAVIGATAYFVATTGPQGARRVELWRTDGTAGGTALVAPIFLSETDVAELVVRNGVLYFGARPFDTGPYGIWTYTPGGAATEVLDLGAFASSLPRSLTVFANRVWFAAADTGAPVLWSTDGTSAGTVKQVASGASDPAFLTVVPGTPDQLYYAATAAGQRDLFRTDGAINSQLTFGNVQPAAMTSAGGKLFLSAVDAAHGRELFTWNPFAGALVLLADALPGPASSSPTFLTPFGSFLLFGATDPSSPSSLWQSDGTPAGTTRVFASGGPVVGELASLGAFALLCGTDQAGPELWRTDRSAAGTSSIADIHPNLASSFPDSLVAWNGRLFFAADGEVGQTAVGRELWTTTGAPGAGATLAADIYIQNSDPNLSSPSDLVATASGILFAATDALHGRELWFADGVSFLTSTALVKDVNPDSVVNGGYSIPVGGLQTPAWLAPLGSSVLFAADGGSSTPNTGRELWITDGTGPGTTLLFDVLPGAASSNPYNLTPAGGRIWFSATDPSQNSAIWSSDGTPSGTRAAPGLDCFDVDQPVYDAKWFADLNGAPIFAARNDVPYNGEVKPFRFDGTCVRRVIDDVAWFSEDPMDPTAFTVVGGVGWFGARGASGTQLWRTDGFPSGTRPVVRIGTQGGGRISSIAGVGGLLYLVANDEQHGDELWIYDPVNGTTAVRDLFPGPVGSMEGSTLLPLPGRGRVLFAADDGRSGRELWISDGSALNTRLLQDLHPGPQSSNPANLTAVGDLVFFTADDGANGRELWVLDTSPSALDLTPPVPYCPATPMVFEATKPGLAGADPVYAITASDDRGGAVALSYSPPSGTSVGLGDTATVIATAVDETGNVAQCGFLVRVRDSLAPTITCPAAVQVEATSAAGAAASFEATAVDTVTPSAAIVFAYSIPPGSSFPLGAGFQPGTTQVTATATDQAGNTSSCTFGVTVSDTTPPAMTCPAPAPVEATSYAGAVATWPDIGVSDLVSPAGSITVGYDHARGATYPLGATTITATATDAVGNAGTCAFPVLVVDTTPPIVSCPPDAAYEATSPAGTFATFAATATDLASPTLALFYSDLAGTYASGEPVSRWFPVQLPGASTVSYVASARDASGNLGSCNFIVTVRDTTPPAVTCSVQELFVEATGPDGASATVDGLAFATDAATAAPTVTFSPPSGLFPLQASKAPTSTPVLASSTDASGNTGTCGFTVTVHDTTPPAVTRPCGVGVYDLVQEATGPDGALVTLPRDFADLVSAPDALQYTWVDEGTVQPLAAATLQPLGAMVVDETATDEAGNVSAVCTLVSHVVDTTPPSVICPPDLAVEASSPAGAQVSWADVTAVDLVTSTALLRTTYADAATGAPLAQGDTFGVPTATTILATVTDEAGNAASCTFSVAVVDRTAPTIVSCPAPDPVEATTNGTALVSFDAAATDSITLSPSLVYSTAAGAVVHPGDPFPVGTTDVTATALDAAGNAARCQFAVVVTDTTPPAMVCPDARTVISGGPVAVTFPPPTVVDYGSAPGNPPVIQSTKRSGDTFPMGSTVVTFTATDASGNSSYCTMTVTVQAPPPQPASKHGGGCGTGGSGGAVALLGVALAMIRPRRRA
jgi:ELWxxDGT repeat protein